MKDSATAARLELIESLSAAFLDATALRLPEAPTAWQAWPTAADLVEHVGRIYAWVSAIVRTGASVDRRDMPGPDGAPDAAWYAERRTELLRSLSLAEPGMPCWTLRGPDGTAGFWHRRMVFETAKHLVDLRFAGSADPMEPPPELPSMAAADGVDELFEVFLSRSRSTLQPLPAAFELRATDLDRRWLVSPDWEVGASGTPAAAVEATAAELLLFVWQRADPFDLPERFTVVGDPATVRAFAEAPIHA
jgi:uncharacterized protein (TIGR03083 family)